MQQSLELRLGERLRRLRRQRGMTLEALAAVSGISKSMISLAERGESSPSAGVLDKLAGALGIPTGVLFYLCVTPPLYKHFGLLPLLLPVCPHCNRRPNGYRVNEHGWPRMIVACGQCDRVSELWWRRPSAASVPPGSPRLLLSWPHSLGRWRLIARETL